MNVSPCGYTESNSDEGCIDNSNTADSFSVFSPEKELKKSSPVSSLFPSDPVRQAKRLPIRVLKMLSAHTGHLMHPEYLQPLTSAPISIELDAKKSPLALLAQTCSQIGKPDPPPCSKLNSATSNGVSDKDSANNTRSAHPSTKHGDHHHQSVDDKSSFKPYAKAGGESRKDGSNSGNGDSNKTGYRLPGGACPPFPPHSASSPNSRVGSPQQQQQGHTPHEAKQSGDLISQDKKEQQELSRSAEAQLANSSHVRASANSSNASSQCSPHHGGSDPGKAEPPPQQQQHGHAALGSGHVAPVSPYKPGHSVYPLPPSSLGYHGSIVGAYAGYPTHYGLDHTKSSLVGGQLGVPGKHPSSSPLTGASPPSFMQGLCRDPYCLTYPNAPHLGGSNCSSCVHDHSSTLKSGYPLVYPTHPLHSLHASPLTSSATPTLSGHPLYTYGFMLQNDPAPHICNWVSASGPCDKRFASSEELLAHLRTHTALPGADKLLAGYPGASCHLHLPSTSPGSPTALPGTFSLRSPHSLGLSRYHPYSKSHMPASGLPMHALQTAPYYSPYALYSQRLTSASALGYQ